MWSYVWNIRVFKLNKKPPRFVDTGQTKKCSNTSDKQVRDCEKIRILFRRNDSGGWSISCVCYALGTKMLFLLLGL